MTQKPLSIYIHIPFCVKKCAYCDFLSFPAEEDVRRNYLHALKQEIIQFAQEYESWYFGNEEAELSRHSFLDSPNPERSGKDRKVQHYVVVSVFIGGGTPSILDASQIIELLDLVRDKFEVLPSAEITIEANPGTVSAEKLNVYRRAGVNRISLGLQSANDRELHTLGRIHTYGQFLESYRLARHEGFENINIDLMSALPGQTLSSWKDTLRNVVSLSPEHISAYSLIIEEGTPFYERYHEQDERRSRGESVVPCNERSATENQLKQNDDAEDNDSLYLPDEETERDIYHWTGAYLKQHGYSRYEISNYARPGRECVHNIGYWQRREYVGFGPGAASLLGDVRYTNTKDMGRYLKAGREAREQEQLTQQDRMEELMFLGLRMTQGVSKEVFCKETGRSINQVYQEELDYLKTYGLLEETPEYVRLTEAGLDISNYCMAQFIK